MQGRRRIAVGLEENIDARGEREKERQGRPRGRRKGFWVMLQTCTRGKPFSDKR